MSNNPFFNPPAHIAPQELYDTRTLPGGPADSDDDGPCAQSEALYDTRTMSAHNALEDSEEESTPTVGGEALYDTRTMAAHAKDEEEEAPPADDEEEGPVEVLVQDSADDEGDMITFCLIVFFSFPLCF